MHPFLFDLGTYDLPLLGEIHLRLPAYGVLVATALVVGWIWIARRAMRRGIDVDAAMGVVFWGLVGGLAGGKIGLLVVDLPLYLSEPSRLLSADFLQAAGVVWTAILGGLLGLVLAARHSGMPLGEIADLIAVPMPVCQAIGRLGCMAAGCCFGGTCAAPWGVTYHSVDAHLRTGVPLGTPLHPAPLYEALFSLAIVLPLVLLADRRRRTPGEAAAAYFATYGAGRFVVEFFRGDAVRGVWLGGTLSTSQILSLLIVPVALAVWWTLRRRAPAEMESGTP